jgi:hypothetical protein
MWCIVNYDHTVLKQVTPFCKKKIEPPSPLRGELFNWH